MGNHEPSQCQRDPNRLANRYWDRGGGTGSIHPKAKTAQMDALALNRNNGRMPPGWPPNPPATEGRLSGFVCRFQFGQVHREVEHDLDWFSVRMGIVIAINVHLHLPAVANDSAPSMLK